MMWTAFRVYGKNSQNLLYPCECSKCVTQSLVKFVWANVKNDIEWLIKIIIESSFCIKNSTDIGLVRSA